MIGERSPIRWQHRLKREHPTCTERPSLIKSADGRVATVAEGTTYLGLVAIPRPWASFLPRVIVAERSSPSRVRLRRAERALDRSRPLCPNTARKKRKNGDQSKQNLTTTGLLMEGHSASYSETIHPATCDMAILVTYLPRGFGLTAFASANRFCCVTKLICRS